MSHQSNVLIIEDNDFVRMQIVKFLRDEDYNVFEATSVEAALKIVDEKKDVINCMLVDVRMEPIDGFGFLKKMRAEGNSVPVILVTGDQNSDILSKASDFGVSSVLMKPVNKDRLIKMVQRTISGASHAS